ncbi:16S rRNA (uracil(1498)-N(3))-methyltransferase [Reichenbachiella sp. MALMAid0571]|uniref:16S rRNA (uracil(1498)-N(3))-methyltransferase n=1 Tax=Reichenbachiella sp. MALMAid0571 TaxID=3143939 RepID=UPI0032DF1844
MNYFYNDDPEHFNFLNSEESNHCIKVLRKKKGDVIDVIDGKGNVFSCEITADNFRKCEFSILDKKASNKHKPHTVHIAIAPTKNHDRLEWFVEKSSELGVDEISFITTKRTERKKINLERLDRKTLSALKQSKNLFKTKINKLSSLKEFLETTSNAQQKFIAFVDNKNPDYLHKIAKSGTDTLILIGPEGDFTEEEVAVALSKGFQKISLGKSVLRTETAGVIACHSINLINE